jgi:hypothetical protein
MGHPRKPIEGRYSARVHRSTSTMVVRKYRTGKSSPEESLKILELKYWLEIVRDDFSVAFVPFSSGS